MSPTRNVVWMVPLVVVVCALMVLPGATYLSSFAHSGGPSSSAAGTAFGRTGSLSDRSSSGANAGSSAPSLSSAFGGILPSYASQPWVQSLTHSGPALKPLTSLPNINILKGTVQPVQALSTPGYAAPPAPLGLGDFGLGTSPYAYNTSHILGSVTFTTPPNATQPSASGVILPDSGGQHEGYVGSPFEFGIQLNTIATNITIPGSNTAFFWTQNVVNWNDTGIHFVDDTFNATGGGFGLNDIFSGCNNNTAGAQHILVTYGLVFQCVGTTIPISPADYPITIQLYNNATVNAQLRDQVSYGYRIIEAGTGTVLTGISDTVVFVNPNSTAPAYTPGFTVDGFTGTPGNFLRDSEIVIVGGIGGDNAQFRSISGSMSLQYSNASFGGWKNVPSAYNFGGNTGETSGGIADYWTPSHTLVFNQGPSLLYGLWGAEPQVSVASGDIHIAGSISPTYGFVFLSNLPPDAVGTNMSWVPTTDTGTFDTYLPPLGAPWATQYYMQGFAAGSGEVNGTAITGTTTTYTLTLPLAPGVLRAPLYMYSNAQASSLAANISGSSSPPYVFSNMQVDVNFTFNHFNDYTYPTFDLVNVQGVTQPVTIDNVTQGNDSATGTYYFYVYSSAPGLLSGPGEILPFDLPNYTAAINIYGGSQDKVTNEVLTGIIITFGFPAMGGSVFLWGDTGASVTNVVAQESSPGVYVGHCALTTVSQLTAQFFATGVTDVANSQMVGTGITVIDSVGVYAYGTTGSTYSYVNLTEGGRGFIVGGDFGDPYYDLPGTVGLTINHLNVTNGGIGANLTFATHTTVNVLGTYDTGGLYGSGGAWLDGTFGTTFTTVSAYGGEAWGIDMWNATFTNITGYVLTNSADLASIWDYSSNTAVVGMTMFNYSAGVISGIYGGHLVDTSFSNVAMTEFDVGVDLLDPTSTSFTTVSISASVGGPGIALAASQYSTFSQVSTSGATVGVVIDGGQYSTLTASTVSDHSVGVFLLDAEYSTVTGVTASDAASSSPWSAPPLGLPALSAVLEIGGAFNTVSNVQATNYPAAYYSLGSIEPAVSNVNATGGMFALVLNGTGTGLFTNIAAYQDFVGIEINAGATHNVITMSSFVDSTSYGVLINAGGLNTIYDNSFIGNNGAGSSYSTAHIQASAGLAGPNYFDGSVTIGVDLGNYWSDWHTYDASGHLAPYPLVGGTFDHYPIGAPEGTVAVYFDETGLPSGVSWSVTLNGNQQSTTNSWLVFNVLPGSYSFSVGTVTGYSETPATGNVTASGVSVNEYLTYTAQYVVSVSETGLSSAALASGWSVTVGGVMASSTTVPYLNFTVGPGTYAYQVAPVAGYTASPSSGSLTVVNGAYQLLVTFTQLTYSVTITESGLANGASWSATVNGNAIPSTGSTITFTLPSGPYTVQVSNVSGYTLSSASLEVTVNGAPTGASVTYTPTSSPSYVKTGDFNNWLAVLLAVAVIALVVGLLALMLRRRKEPPAQSAQAWSPPPPSGSGGTPPPSGGAPGWSEGPPPGGST